jgi:hypothetical protein
MSKSAEVPALGSLKSTINDIIQTLHHHKLHQTFVTLEELLKTADASMYDEKAKKNASRLPGRGMENRAV